MRSDTSTDHGPGRGARLPPLVAVAVGVLVAAAVLGCRAVAPAGGSAPVNGRLVARWIEQDPQTVFDPSAVFGLVEIFDWSFADPVEREAWRVPAGVDASAVPGGLRLPRGDDPIRIERRADFDAADVDRIELEIRGRRRARTRLAWAAGRGLFGRGRSMALDPQDVLASRAGVFTFEVGRLEAWDGAVAKLRLEPPRFVDQDTDLVAVRGWSRRPDGDALAAAITRPWKLGLGDDVRNVLLAPPGVPHRRSFTIAAGQRLQLAYGLEPAIREPVTFEVVAETAGGSTTTLLRETVAAGEAGRWIDASLALDDLAGREVTIRLETRSPTTPNLAHGFPIWANPELRQQRTASAPPEAVRAPRRPNVVFVSIDTLRADHLSSYGYARETSPQLDRWARRRAARFAHAVVQAPWTLPSHVSMLTGLEAMRHGVNHYGAAPAELLTLAERLHVEGYATTAVTGGGYLRPQFGFTQGFERFVYWPEILAEEELAHGMTVALETLDAHAGGEQPFFLFFHTYEVHFPHRKRQPFFRRLTAGEDLPRADVTMGAVPWPGRLTWGGNYFAVRENGGERTPLTDGEKRLVVAMYDSAIGYVDQQLGRLFDRLEQLGLGDDTLVVVTSDHGEALGEDDVAGHNYLDEHNLKVPLLIALPGGAGAGREVETQVRSIDIVPTILEALGLPAQPVQDGVSLVPLIDGSGAGHAVVPEEAWSYAASANFGINLRLRNRLAYRFNNTAWEGVLGSERLHDLRRPATARTDRASVDAATAVALRERVEAHMTSLHPGYRLAIRNPGPGTLRGRLTGAWVDHAKVKSLDPACACVQWRPGEPARFALAPGQSTLVFLEDPIVGEVGIEGSWTATEGGVAEPFRLSLTLGDGSIDASGVRFVRGAAGWRRQAVSSGEAEKALAAADPSFRLWRAVPIATRAATRDDAALRQQLEALGYID